MNLVRTAPALEIPHPYDPDYWRTRFSSEPYVAGDDRFEEFEPAYRFGHSLQGQFDDFELWEDEAESLWDSTKGDCRIPWDRAKFAIRAAWEDAEHRAQSRFDAALQRGVQKVSDFVHGMEESVRRRPAEWMLGSAAGGYLTGKLPVRSLLKGAMGAVLAIAPGGLIALGLWQAARRINRSHSQPQRIAAAVIIPEELETSDTVRAVVLTDVS